MQLSDDTYVPALRWRQAEYQALKRLGQTVKDQIVPLITIPDVEYDFEQQEPKRTVDEHVRPFITRYQEKWGQRPAWIALNEAIANGRMDDGSHVFDYVFSGLRLHDAQAVPALPLAADSATIAAVSTVVAHDRQGSAILVRLEDLMADGPEARVVALAKDLQVGLKGIDLIIDLKAPNFEPYDSFATALIAYMPRLGDLMAFRKVVLVSTAIPETLADISKGTDAIPRHDWLFYQTLLKKLPGGMRRPVYGDYTIVHPNFEAKDMRIVKPAGKIIYTREDMWGTRKGDSFRDNRDQMHSHCQAIVLDAGFDFRGQDYSWGDAYISDCAARRQSASNLGQWKKVAINHHITLVVEELANLGAVA